VPGLLLRELRLRLGLSLLEFGFSPGQARLQLGFFFV
jgi:hypothetical protein